MSEKPIIFSTDMVRAILDGRKTVTRRVIKPQPRHLGDDVYEYNDEVFIGAGSMANYLFHEVYGGKGSPYGAVYGDGSADELWVRETWRYCDLDSTSATIHYKSSGCTKRIELGENWKIKGKNNWGWQPSIFMPRWASRIQLRVTDVRVERVQEITEEQATKEGMELVPVGTATWSNKQSFSILWDKINAKRGYSWESNPFVWVVEFEVIKP